MSPILESATFTNPANASGAPLTLTNGGNYGCGGACNSSQSGGYRFKKERSKRSRSKRRAHGTKRKTRRSTKSKKGGKKCRKTRARGNKKRRTRRRTRRRMRGGSMTGLSPGSVGENISLHTSYENSDIPSSFGYSVAGDVNTLSGVLANPPPHTRYQQCPGA